MEYLHAAHDHIFGALVENEALEQLRKGNNKALQKVLSAQIDRRQYTNTRFDSSVFYWKIMSNEQEHTGFVRFFRSIYNCPRLDALATLADIVGMSYENTFFIHDVDDPHATEKYGKSGLENHLPTSFSVNIEGKQEYAFWLSLIEIKGCRGQTISAIALYRLGNQTISFPVSTAHGKLTIGKNKTPAHFYNQSKVDDNPGAVIFLCQNIGDALILDKVFENLEKEVVVVGHYGHDLEPFPWNFFKGRKVVLICSLYVERYLQVEEYKAYLAQVNVAEFKVSPFPILDGKTPEDFAEFMDTLSPLGKELLANAIFADDPDSVNIVKNKITDGALSYDDYKAWGEDIEIFVKSARSLSSVAHDVISYTPPEGFQASPETLSEVAWGNIFPLEGTALVCAKKNIGKTRMTLPLSGALIRGNSFLGIKTLAPHKSIVLYDSETTKTAHEAMRKQFGIADMWQISIYGALEKAPDENAELKGFNLSSPEAREKMTAYAQKKRAQYTIIDNITSAVRDKNSIYTPKFAQDVFDWGNDLNTKGTGLILVHHLHETHKNSLDVDICGSGEWLRRAHTILSLIGPEEVLSNTKKYPDIIAEKSRTRGATIGIYFKTCKMAGILERTILWAHLPYGASDWELFAHTDMEFNELEDSLALTVDAIPTEVMSVDAIPVDVMPAVIEQTPVVEEEVAESADVPADAAVPVDADSPATHVPLTYEEKIVLALITDNNYIKTSNTMEALDCSETTARGVLNSLIAKGFIKREGESSATKYFLNK